MSDFEPFIAVIQVGMFYLVQELNGIAPFFAITYISVGIYIILATLRWAARVFSNGGW
jgi:ABC-type Na+ efflux pump permease subunit